MDHAMLGSALGDRGYLAGVVARRDWRRPLAERSKLHCLPSLHANLGDYVAPRTGPLPSILPCEKAPQL